MQQQFDVTIEGTIQTTPVVDATRNGFRFTKFDIVNRRETDGEPTAKVAPMHFSVICWGKLADRVAELTRGTDVIIQASRLSIDTYSEPPVLMLAARNVSVSMRRNEAHPGSGRNRRRADLVTTADGETFDADTYAEASTDFEALHR
ncbi:single-stranded DNA-binding protein [Dactylosporangium sp. NPDC005572]|uniref:single-stranded DNA-binding protein n=1 Tax=Dactylosporangium sp. NPDC005572 TaxID=3156889 RepID=UPI0033BC5880